MAYPVISSDPVVQARYEQARAQGSQHVWAEMFALRRSPGAKTNREFFRGTPTLADQFRGDESMLEKLVEKAERLGRRPHYTDVYAPELCSQEIGPGDPAAFVPASEGTSHVKRVCQKRNLDCSGLVNVTTPTLDPKDRPKPKKIPDNPIPTPKRVYETTPLKQKV